jgi:hypothetical protein
MSYQTIWDYAVDLQTEFAPRRYLLVRRPGIRLATIRRVAISLGLDKRQVRRFVRDAARRNREGR